MEHFAQYWPRRKSAVTLAAGVMFVLVAFDIRCWGILIDIAPQNAGGILFWFFLLIGCAAMFGSAAALTWI